MHLTLAQLDDLRQRLERSGRQHYCPAPREGRRFVPKPKAKAAIGTTYPDGLVLTQEMVDGELRRGVWLPPAPHGTAFLGIDPQTGQIACTACQGKQTA